MDNLRSFLASAVWSLIILNSQLYSISGTPLQHYGRCESKINKLSVCRDISDCTTLTTSQLADTALLEELKCSNENAKSKQLVCCPRSQAASSIHKLQLLPQAPTCGSALQSRIRNGRNTNIDDFPWMALIRYTNGDDFRHLCGGSLVSERWVLTAAHCVKGQIISTGWEPDAVRLGEWNTATETDCFTDTRGRVECADPHIDVELDLIIPHPGYNQYALQYPNDIALIRLSRSVPYSNFIKPICLPSSSTEDNYVGTTMDIAGWGLTDGRGIPSSVKQRAEVQVLSNDVCQLRYRTSLTQNQICAGNSDASSCFGDSGGPMMMQHSTGNKRVSYYLLGIISLGMSGCNSSGLPMVLTKVKDYVAWIEQDIQKNS